MLRAAEAALAEAKAHPDRTAVHGEPRGRGARDRARLVAELHEADRARRAGHALPAQGRTSGDLRVVGAEALVRWEHPERGLLLPADFLGAVEAANLIAGRHARRCCATRSDGSRGGCRRSACDPDFAVCVNFSLDDLRRKRFAHDVFAALEDARGRGPPLVLELTEQTMLADAIGARDVLDELRRSGIQIAIDDFGTGYSSLEHIRVFEVDELKIDRSFVQRLGRSRTDEAIVDSVIAIAQRLGVLVTAEGIEDEQSLAYLRQRRCTLGQGYLFDRPVAGDAFDPGQRYRALT